MNLTNWKGAPRPERAPLDGRYARLEPFALAQHSATLFEAARAPGATERFRYLPDNAPADLKEFQRWFEVVAAIQESAVLCRH
jgi:hypothetical protein